MDGNKPVNKPEIRITNNGMRVGVPIENEMRGNDEIYDPWLRIPKDEMNRLCEQLMNLYTTSQISELINKLNEGGINHINRKFFDKLWNSITPTQYATFANVIFKKCSKKVNILFMQMYSHHLLQSPKYEELLKRSIEFAKSLQHPSWDKWVASGYFWLARYSTNHDEKIKYCIAALLEPREIESFSPHMKYWKMFRMAAWLVGNRINTPEAQKAIKRFRNLNFIGYAENNDIMDAEGYLDNPERCLKIMKNIRGTKPGDLIGNP